MEIISTANALGIIVTHSYSWCYQLLIPSSAICFVFRFHQNDQKSDFLAPILMVYEGRLICFWFSNSLENFGQNDIWWYPTNEIRLSCNLRSKKWFLPYSVPPKLNISISKAEQRNSNRPNSLENSAESESAIRSTWNAIFEEIAFSRENFFFVIFSVNRNPYALFKNKTYGTQRYMFRDREFDRTLLQKVQDKSARFSVVNLQILHGHFSPIIFFWGFFVRFASAKTNVSDHSIHQFVIVFRHI